ncbi:MAG: ECF transporter S component [Eubacteriales bacterium]|nr:ECF transporter S component [Eubacteriales bacterium]
MVSRRNADVAKKKVDIQWMVMTALFIALTYVITGYINIRIPFLAANGGLVHLGNVPVFVAAALYGRRSAAISGAFGMGLFDLTCGWVAWAPFTFVVCGLIGWTFGLITEKHPSKAFLVVGVLAALVIKIGGYYVAEGIIYGNWIAPLTSIPGNVVQIIVAGVIAVPLIIALQKVIHR